MTETETMEQENQGAAAAAANPDEREQNLGKHMLRLAVQNYKKSTQINDTVAEYEQKSGMIEHMMKIISSVTADIKNWINHYINPIERLLSAYYETLRQQPINIDDLNDLTAEEQELLQLAQQFDIEQLNPALNPTDEENELLALASEDAPLLDGEQQRALGSSM